MENPGRQLFWHERNEATSAREAQRRAGRDPGACNEGSLPSYGCTTSLRIPCRICFHRWWDRDIPAVLAKTALRGLDHARHIDEGTVDQGLRDKVSTMPPRLVIGS